jgi:predicted DNA-binding protein (MmcQ/YjbR family)
MKLSPDKVLARVRKLCLSYPESNETAAWGHPNFRAGKKAFVTFERWEGRPSIAFRVQDAEKEKVRPGGEFFVTPYGRGQWLSLWIDKPVPEWPVFESLIDKGYRLVALKRMLTSLDT